MIAQICGVDIAPCHKRGISDDNCYPKCKYRKANNMAADFSNFDPFGIYNAGEAKATYSFNPGLTHYGDNCNCNDCLGKRVREQMRANTCRCGHVGAECFNDSYCEPVPTVAADRTCEAYARRLEKQVNELDSALQEALAEIQAMKEAHKVVQQTANAWERNFHVAMDNLNDLQADYADEMMWRDMESETDEATISHQSDRIDELETTIRVLSGMVSE